MIEEADLPTIAKPSQKRRRVMASSRNTKSGVTPVSNAATVTVLTHGSFIGKRFQIKDGALLKTSQPTFYEGTAQSVDAPDVDALANLLTSLTPSDVLTLGRMKDGKTSARVVTGDKVNGDVIARSLAHFEHSTGEGWLLLDHDTKDMPDHVRARVEALGGGVAAIRRIWPELAEADLMVRPSSSGGVYIDGGNPATATGFHMFVRVADVSQSTHILKTLLARGWEEGLSWHTVGKSGALLERSIVDAAVGGPERLVFTAPPELGDGVRRAAPEIVIQRGVALAAPDAPQADMHSLMKRKSRQRLKPEAEKVEAAYTETHIEKIVATGVTRADAVRQVRDRLQGKVLGDDDILQMSDGNHTRVGDILDTHFKVAGAAKMSLPDPTDGLEYGKTTAAIIWKVGFSEPALISQAHGTQTHYKFARYMSDFEIEAHKAEGDFKRGIELGDIPEAAEIAGGKEQTLIDALTAADSRTTAQAVAFAVIDRRIGRTPHSLTPDALVGFVQRHLQDGLLTESDVAGLRHRIARINHTRKAKALEFVSLKNLPKGRKQFVTSLDDAEIPIDGITIVKAPMGAGKTQKIGKPWIDRALSTKMAICHRISLVDELSRRLGLPHYKRAKPEDILDKNGIAVCLPSITANIVESTFPMPDYQFIDEIAQVLRFLESKDVCRTKKATSQGVFNTLVEMIRSARGVLVADADVNDRVIQFLEYCRPDDLINLVLMPPTSVTKAAKVLVSNDPSGAAMRGRFIDEIVCELEGGGKCWIACESAKLVEDLAAVLEGYGHNALGVTAQNKDTAAQRAFLNDADAASRRYDVVIVSPAVVSGISIEHEDRPHFTLGGFIGAGHAIVPSDAMQMLARVRYLTDHIIGLSGNNASGGQTSAAITRGWEGLANIENAPVDVTFYDHMRADIQAAEANAKADFAAGLYWMLEGAGWALDVVDVTRASKAEAKLDAAKEERVAKWNATVMAADIPDDLTAEFLRGRVLTENERAQLEAYDITQTLKLASVDDAAIANWDEGRFKSKMRRFASLTGDDIVPRVGFEKAELVRRRFDVAEQKLLRGLFDGIDLTAEYPFTPEAQEMFVDRVMAQRVPLVAAKILPTKYRTEYVGKGGVTKAMQRPKNTKVLLKGVLERLGFCVTETRIRLSQNMPPLYKDIQSEGVLGQQDNRVRVYGISAESWAFMQGIRDREQPEPVQSRATPIDTSQDLAERFAPIPITPNPHPKPVPVYDEPAEIVNAEDIPELRPQIRRMRVNNMISIAPYMRSRRSGLQKGGSIALIAEALHRTKDRNTLAAFARISPSQVQADLDALFVLGLVDRDMNLEGAFAPRKLVMDCSIKGSDLMAAFMAQRRFEVRAYA